MLKKFEKIFVQDQQSLDLLDGIGLKNVILAGDTRFDRVVQITGTARDIPQIEQFRGDEKLFLAGSSWKQDEEIIAQYINRYPDKMKWVFAPHEIDKPNIERLEKLLNVKVVRFSEFNPDAADARVLIIDNIGCFHLLIGMPILLLLEEDLEKEYIIFLNLHAGKYR